MNKYGLRDEIIESVTDFAKKRGIEKIILFGSRARGDHSPRSDIDIAVKGGDITNFAFDVEDETPTLLKFDVVDLDRPVQDDLLDSISKEGVVIYEKV